MYLYLVLFNLKRAGNRRRKIWYQKYVCVKERPYSI